METNHPSAWLQEQGFDPDGDLCKPIQTKRDRLTDATAMFEASRAGKLQ
jgi:hypothetical protein